MKTQKPLLNTSSIGRESYAKSERAVKVSIVISFSFWRLNTIDLFKLEFRKEVRPIPIEFYRLMKKGLQPKCEAVGVAGREPDQQQDPLLYRHGRSIAAGQCRNPGRVYHGFNQWLRPPPINVRHCLTLISPFISQDFF
jgi:hypothetical protein